jgi:hypothetical protein
VEKKKLAAARDGWRPDLAEVLNLDCLGDELEEEPLEVHWIRLPATERIAFDHKFEPASKAPAASQ